MFFDNLSIKHYTGPMLEETHYYPFGLTMAGISSKAIGKIENRYKFNDGTELSNKEFGDGSGLELYETSFRGYDPQVGRFWQVDPLAEINENWSPYSFANDNPILLNDPLGLEGDTAVLPEVIVPGCTNCEAPKTYTPPNVNPGPPPPNGSATIDPNLPNNAGLPAVPFTPPLTVVPPPGGVVPFASPEITPVVGLPFLLTLIGVLIPQGGPEFPGNDELIYIKNPELRETLKPNPQPYQPPDLDDHTRRNIYLIRFGTGPESREKLASEALQAANTPGFAHGVSTKLKFRISGTDKLQKAALLVNVMKYFGVKKTGKNPDHYTVILPNPVTQQVADLFNSIFKNE